MAKRRSKAAAEGQTSLFDLTAYEAMFFEGEAVLRDNPTLLKLSPGVLHHWKTTVCDCTETYDRWWGQHICSRCFPINRDVARRNDADPRLPIEIITALAEEAREHHERTISFGDGQQVWTVPEDEALLPTDGDPVQGA